MNRSARIIVAGLALVLLVAGTALATRMGPADRHPGPLAASHQASPGESEDGNEPSESPDEKANDAETNDQAGGAPLTDAHAQALVSLLADAGIDGVTADELKTLAAKYGVGGAVRLEAWAKATGKSATELATMYDEAAVGWGAFARQLEAADSALDLSPGIGSIMGHGHGHGPGGAKPKGAPGQS